MEYPKKLIEVALPLDDINAAAAREKSIRHGHPSILHLWWARRPLAAARAVLFAQLVNDPGGKRGYGKYKGQSKADAQRERERLFQIIRDLVKWENTTNEEVLEKARKEIRKSWKETCDLTGEDPEKMPPFLDPFAGGGSIPLEAQRLGLEAHASDLNPVAVMINKAMIEIPPKFAGRKPVGPIPSKEEDKQINFSEKDWSGANGLAEDVRRYGHWMREEAFKSIGHLYPQVDLPEEYGGGKATVIAWLWARTVASPNPAVNGVHVPLISNFFLSTKKGKEAWVHPIVEVDRYYFTVKTGKPENPDEIKKGTKLSRGANFQCLLTGVPIAPDYIKAEGKAGRMRERLMAIVAEGAKGRIYLEPNEEMEKIAAEAQPGWRPDNPLPKNPRWFSPPDYGMPNYADLFTPRQLVALTTFSDLVQEAREKVIEDYMKQYPLPNPPPLGEGINATNTSTSQHEDKDNSSPQRGEVGRGVKDTSSSQRGDKDNPSPQHGNKDNPSPQRGEVGRGAKNNNSPHWRPSPAPPNLIKTARNLRKNLTDAEQLLWHCIRRKQLDGFRFRRQHPIGNYILDFYCPEAKLAIELDGGQHNLEKEKKSDEERTAWLKNNGVRVLRFWNNEVFGNLEGVLQQIWDVLHETSPPPRPSPAGGGSGRDLDEASNFAEGGSGKDLDEGSTFAGGGSGKDLDERNLDSKKSYRPYYTGGGSGKNLDKASNFAGGASNNNAERTTLAGEERIRSGDKRTSLGGSMVCPGGIGNQTQDKRNFHDSKGLNDGGLGATAYGDAVAVYLAFAVDKVADYWSSICTWHSSGEKMRNTFGRQAIPMVWDYAEANPFCSSTGNWIAMIDWVWKSLLMTPANQNGTVFQNDAATHQKIEHYIFSTDPPYFDNIGYADLSDFFYVWLRQSLKNIFPEIFSTMLVPKEKELVATPYRHGSKQKAETFFMESMTKAIQNMAISCHPYFPVTIYYAFKQSDTAEAGTSSTGWETFLSAVIKAGFVVTGTWPMRTERTARTISIDTNALASSIILVCRKRNFFPQQESISAGDTRYKPSFSQFHRHEVESVIDPGCKLPQTPSPQQYEAARTFYTPSPQQYEAARTFYTPSPQRGEGWGGGYISRKQFVRELEQSLPEALEDMIGGKDGTSPIAPVDLAQAAIGPGMAVYSKYSGVLEADGTPMSVYTALTLINKAIDEYFTRAESSMGPDTRFCVDWFQQYGFREGPFGEADVLARAKGTTVEGVQKAGVIQSGKGKVRLLKVSEYPDNWDPTRDLRVPAWEACHHLSRTLKNSEMVAATLLARMPEQEEPIRQLAYRLYTLCERKGWAEDARNYNELITSWHAIVQASYKIGHRTEQMRLEFDQ